jgi:hypothetical protein
MPKKSKYVSQSQVKAYETKLNQSTPTQRVTKPPCASPNLEFTSPRFQSSSYSPLDNELSPPVAKSQPVTTSASSSKKSSFLENNPNVRLVNYDEFSLLQSQVKELTKKFESSILNHREKVNPIEYNGKI